DHRVQLPAALDHLARSQRDERADPRAATPVLARQSGGAEAPHRGRELKASADRAEARPPRKSFISRRLHAARLLASRRASSEAPGSADERTGTRAEAAGLRFADEPRDAEGLGAGDESVALEELDAVVGEQS